MPASLPLTTKISQTSSAERQYRVIEVQYGNGYAQRAKDGINNVVDSWSVSWENIDATDFGTLTAAFDTAYGADYFNWTAPGDSSSKKWIVSKFSKRAVSGGHYSVSATLTQDFSL